MSPLALACGDDNGTPPIDTVRFGQLGEVEVGIMAPLATERRGRRAPADPDLGFVGSLGFEGDHLLPGFGGRRDRNQKRRGPGGLRLVLRIPHFPVERDETGWSFSPWLPTRLRRVRLPEPGSR